MIYNINVLYGFLVTVNAEPHECVIRTGLPLTYVKADNEGWFYSKQLYHLAPLPQYRRKTYYLVLKTPAK